MIVHALALEHRRQLLPNQAPQIGAEGGNNLIAVRALAAPILGFALAAGLLSGCTQRNAAPDLPAFPASLEGSPSLELGQLVLMLMPAPGVSQIPWDHQANSAIVWRSSGYEDSPAGAEVTSSRNGLVRVNVDGVVSTVLHKRKEEMAWTVTYTSKSNPKFGVERIEISPGLIEEPCFGSTYSGCSFDPPSRSLADAGIKATEICKATGGGDRGALYRVEHADKQTMLLLWSTSGGSGGESSSIELLIDHGKGEAEAECARYKSTLIQPSAATEASRTTRPLG